MSARYQHTAMTDIRRILTEAADFGLDDDLEAEADGSLAFPWFETGPGRPSLPAPIGRRILANLTLTPATLEVETMSQARLEACSRRLEQLLGQRIHLVGHRIEPLNKAGQKRQPPARPASSFTPSPEFIAELEEQMLRQWIDESIPALGGLTPRQAVKTPAGRRQVLALIDYAQQMQQGVKRVPGMFAPDYRKVKEMLGLE